ncbi:MAG: hypothetical protein V3W34_11750 [Phycisphaerae bacterium]
MERRPDHFAPPPTERTRRKWELVISAFMENRLDELRSIQRTGARGRIFSALAGSMLRKLGMNGQPEPVFDHINPDSWYVDFASTHGLKLRTHEFYNPDFLLGDGTWLEITLSENEAYKKLLRYGHQAPRLLIVWLDEDAGLHKEVCKGVVFPNADVMSVDGFYADLEDRPGGTEFVETIKRLKHLKGQIL